MRIFCIFVAGHSLTELVVDLALDQPTGCASQPDWPEWNVIAPTNFAAVSATFYIVKNDRGALAAEVRVHRHEGCAGRRIHRESVRPRASGEGNMAL